MGIEGAVRVRQFYDHAEFNLGIKQHQEDRREIRAVFEDLIAGADCLATESGGADSMLVAIMAEACEAAAKAASRLGKTTDVDRAALAQTLAQLCCLEARGTPSVVHVVTRQSIGPVFPLGVEYRPEADPGNGAG